MKNQNDLIGLIVSIVIALAGILTFYFTKPTPPAVPAPTAVKTTDAALSPGAVTYANSLGGAAGGAGGFGGAGGGGGLGGRRGALASGAGGPAPGR